VAEEEVDRRELAKLVSDICPKLHYFHVAPKINHKAWDFTFINIPGGETLSILFD